MAILLFFLLVWIMDKCFLFLEKKQIPNKLHIVWMDGFHHGEAQWGLTLSISQKGVAECERQGAAWLWVVKQPVPFKSLSRFECCSDISFRRAEKVSGEEEADDTSGKEQSFGLTLSPWHGCWHHVKSCCCSVNIPSRAQYGCFSTWKDTWEENKNSWGCHITLSIQIGASRQYFKNNTCF